MRLVKSVGKRHMIKGRVVGSKVLYFGCSCWRSLGANWMEMTGIGVSWIEILPDTG